MGSRVDNAGHPQLTSGMHEPYWGIEHAPNGGQYHIAAEDSEVIDPAMAMDLTDKRSAGDYQGWEQVITASPAVTWWARVVSGMLAAGTISQASQAAERWCLAADRLV